MHVLGGVHGRVHGAVKGEEYDGQATPPDAQPTAKLKGHKLDDAQ